MADSFQQRISLEGAEDIIKNLQAIGAEATKAIGQLKTSVTAANPALAALSTSSEAAQKGVLAFTQALGGLSAVLGPVSGGLTTLLSTFTAFGRAGGALAAVGGLVAFTKSAADSVIATQNMARAFGLTVEQFKTLSRAAQQAGVDQEGLNTALGRFAQKASAEAGAQAKSLIDVVKQLQSGLPEIKVLDVEQIKKFQAAVQQALPQVQAAFQQATGIKPSPFFSQFEVQLNKLIQTSETFRASLRELGIDVPAITTMEKLDVAAKKLDGSFASLGISLLGVGTQAKAPFEAFLDLAEKLKNTPDGFQKTALAARTLGRTAGPELLAALNLGREGIEQIQAALAKQGVVFSQDQIDAAKQFRQAIIDLEQSANSFKGVILETFGPTLAASIKATGEELKKLKAIFTGDFKKLSLSDFITFDFDFGRSGLVRFIQSIIDRFSDAGKQAAATFAERFGNIANDPALTKALQIFADKSANAALPQVIKLGQTAKAALDGVTAGLTTGANAWDAYDASVQRAGRDFAANPFAPKLKDILPDPNANITSVVIRVPGLDKAVSDAERLKAAFADIKVTYGPQLEAAANFAAGLAQKIGETKKALGDTVPDAERLRAAFADIKITFGPQLEVVANFAAGLAQKAEAARDAFGNIRLPDLGPATEAMGQLGTSSTTAAGAVNSAFQAVATQGQTALTITQRLIAAMRELATIPPPQSSGDVAGAGAGIPGSGFARGGMIRGLGTGTSDSILARLSRGEFVIRAAAVQHYGPELMAALNAMRLPRLPGFSLGGLADGLGRALRTNLAIPGMAAGGPVPAPAKANAVPITLDLRTDRGRFRGSAMADRDVAEALSRFAVLDQITSMGKKSGAY